MAYTFNGSSQYLTHALSTTITAYPFSLFVRAKSTNLTTQQVGAALIQNAGAYSGWLLGLAGNVALDPAFLNRFGVEQITVGAYSSGVWYALIGTASAAASAAVYQDDSVTSTVVSAALPATPNPNRLMVGARLTPAASLYLTGAAASVALWNVALTAADQHSLAVGFSPRRVRPQNLLGYAPLIRNLDFMAVKVASATSAPFTATGSPTVSEQPRSYGM